MSEVRVPVRVLQSGKVYRQMFDAEVQLVNSLHKIEKFHLPPLKLSGVGEKSKSGNLNSPGHMLTDRQRSWMTGMPNDYITENPVKYRQTTTDVAAKLQEIEPDVEICEVRGLPNELLKTEREPHIIKKISEKRKERHEIAVERMHDDLCTISNRIEPQIIEIGEALLKQFEEDDKKIKCIFDEIKQDEELENFSFNSLCKIWERIEKHTPARREWVARADNDFSQLEKERIEVISGLFRKFAAVLEKVAHLMPADVHRFIEKESMMANQSILANRRAYAKLRINLLERDIQREMMQHLTWEERLQDWKKLNAEIAAEQFIEFMKSDAISNPPEIDFVMEEHMAKQKELQEKRTEILNQLLQFKPPTSTKVSVYKWNSALAKSQENIDQLHLRLVRTLNAKYEAICQKCLAEIDKYRQNLLLSKVCSEEDMQRIVNDHMIPLVGKRQREFENRLEQMDQLFECLAIRTEHQLKRLFKFTQGAAHLWDVHEIGLAKQERKLEDDMDESRQKHDVDNQERESKLDVVMDRLRQESTEEALTIYLQKNLDMLDYIYQGYEEFNEDQLKIVKNYPEMVNSEVQRYDDAVGRFFNVNRNKPAPKSPKQRKRIKRRASISTKEDATKIKEVAAVPRSVSSVGFTSKKRQSYSSGQLEKDIFELACFKFLPSTLMSPRSSAKETPGKGRTSPIVEEEKVVRDTLVTDKGTTFYIITSVNKEDFEEEGEKESKDEMKNQEDVHQDRRASVLSGAAFLTEVSDTSETKEMPEYIKDVYLETSDLRELKKHVRLQFLNHLEVWTDRAKVNSETASRNKQEELASELDLRKHLHNPRSKRIELDVHNVRAAELVLHKERVSRHCKGISAALIGLKQEFDQMTKEQDSQAAEFRGKIEAMEDIFINATKSTKLVVLTNSLHGELSKYMVLVKSSLRDFRQTFDNTLARLRDSNAQCLKSFKLFSQGGNFSPDETVGLRKKLEKMAQRVDAAEGVIMHDLEGMESRRLDQAAEVVSKFEDRFRNHMVDLIFIEKVQRWVTNSQVRIKTEVAHCNGMAANVRRHVNAVKSRIDACKRPNFDKENISPKFLCTYADEVMDCLHDRANYLNCKIRTITEGAPMSSSQMGLERESSSGRSPQVTSAQGGLTTPVPSSSRQKNRQTPSRGPKGGAQKPGTSGGMGPSRTDMHTGGGTSRRGQSQEDAAIVMIKSILRTQKGIDPEYEDLRSVMTGGTRALPSTAASQIGASRMQKNAFYRQGTLASIASSMADSDRGRKSDSERLGSGSYKKRDTKFDSRHMVFGTKSPIGSHFESKVQQILYETLDGLLSTGELYYKQKGGRVTTRPEHMQETFDQFSEVVVAKLLNYEMQTREYHNTTLQEFREQLKTLEEDMAEIPELLLEEVLKNTLDQLRTEQEHIQVEFSTKEETWNNVKEAHNSALRPTLGHPDQQQNLQELITKEEERQKENLSGIQEHSVQLQVNAHEVTKRFLQNIVQNSSHLLEQYDNSLTIDDVVPGKIEPKKEPTSVLIRKKAAGVDLHDTSYKPSLPRGPNVWPGLEASHFLKKEDELSEVLEDINTTKTTLSHLAIIEKRNRCLQTFTDSYNSVMKDIKQQQDLRTHSEERWSENWIQSVKHVKELYE